MSKHKNPYNGIETISYAHYKHPKKERKGKSIFREILEEGTKEGFNIGKETVMTFKDL